MSESIADTFRWQAFFQKSSQPIFLLNRRRRVLFVNRAWEACTGMTIAEVRGRPCRRRAAAGVQEREDEILSACAPPADAIKGRACEVRCRAPGGAGIWEIHYAPIAGEDGILGILGTITITAAPREAAVPLPNKLMALRDRQRARYVLQSSDADDPAIQRMHEQVRLAAQSRLPLTLLGETGVGKEWLARSIHHRGDGNQRFFAKLDAERLPADVIGELLFEPRRRQLGIGTIYLSEPGALPHEWQSRLAEWIKRGDDPDTPRVIVGFRSDPLQAERSRRLLEDLYFAASPLTISIPPLRERLQELPGFIDRFLESARGLQTHTIRGVGAEAMNVLRAHGWPGNLRELRQVLQHACRRAKGDRVELADLPFHLKHGALPVERRLPLDPLLEQVERRLIALALKLTQGNHTRTAEMLAIWRPRLLRRMEKLGIKG